MTYIKLEDLKQYINFQAWQCNIVWINSLPSIDFEEMIKEMIKDYAKLEWIYHDEFDRWATTVLEKLLDKLTK